MPYVTFVGDEDFLQCVEHVYNSYPKSEETPELRTDNGIDPFKMVFDIMNYEISLKELKSRERLRQMDKTVNNTIGEFHQKLLGCVDGWTSFGTGNVTKLDLKKNDNTIFMELKNRFNTVNGDSLAQVRKKLKDNLETYPESINYWAFMIAQNGSSGEGNWRYKGDTNPRLKKLWGNDVYNKVTGSNTALREVWNALPLAINQVRNTGYQLDKLEEMITWFKRAF